MRSSKRYQVEVIETDSGLAAIGTDWTDFENAIGHGNLTASYPWLSAWWDVFGGREDEVFGFDKRLLVVLMRSEGRLVAIAPLVRVRRKRRFQTIECVEFLGQQWAGTLLDLPAEPSHAVEAGRFLLDWLRRNIRHHILRLNYLPAGSPLSALGAGSIHPFSACPAINLREFADFEEYQVKTYSKSLKQNMRTAMNKVRAEGKELKFEFASLDAGSLSEMARLSELKLLDGKHSLYRDPMKAEFILRLSAMDASVLFVTLDGAKVAYRLNIVYCGRKFCLDASYDRAFPKLELGTLSVHESIRESFAKGLALHCEGTGMDFYKLKFIKEALPIQAMVAKGNTLTSGFFAWRERASARLVGETFEAGVKALSK